MNDQQNYRLFFSLTKDATTGDPKLYCFTRDRTFFLNSFVKDLKLDTVIIPLFTQEYWHVFITYNKETGLLRFFKSYWALNAEKVSTYYFTQIKEYTIKTLLTFVGKRISSLSTSLNDYLIIIDEQDMYHIDFKTDEVLKIPELYIKGA